MNIFIVHAHPEPRSFNGAMTQRAVSTLTEAGHIVTVSDLYALKFKAVADTDDFPAEREDPDYLRIDREQTRAHRTGTVAADIAAEQDKLAAADLLILQYPMWWFGMPAILKGWVDRVFTRGFAYLPGGKYDTGMMRGKRAMVAVTTGTSADTYAPDGIDGALIDILWPVHNGILRYSGFDVLPPFAAHMPGKVHVEAIRRNGVLVDAVDGARSATEVRVLHLCGVATLRRRFDAVFVAVKAYDGLWACELIKPYVKSDGLVAGLQNGLTLDTY